jgi:flagellin-like hook-associated protein FlgL
MKTVIEITNDYYSNNSYDYYKEELQELYSQIDVLVTVANNDYNNLLESDKDKEDYKHTLQVDAKGYSQSEWQTYTIYYNDNEDLEYLVSLLEKSFTHFNDYIVSKFESQEINGKEFSAEPHDYTNFSISNIEFPEKEDVLKAYTDMYGKDYDKVIVNID